MSIYLSGNLDHGDYIDFGDSWLINLKWDIPLDDIIKVDDRVIHRGYGTTQEFIEPNSEVFYIKKGMSHITHYENDKGESINAREYNEITSQYLDECGDDYWYPDLDTEYKHRKLMDSYKPIWINEAETSTIIPLKCRGRAEKTGHKRISTALHEAKGTFKNSGFYKVDWSGVTLDILHKFVEDNDLSSGYQNDQNIHEAVRYAKINGSYVIKDTDRGSRGCVFAVYGTLEEALKEIKEHEELLTERLNIRVFGEHYKLKEFITLLKSVNPVEGDVDKYDKCLTMIESFIKK